MEDWLKETTPEGEKQNERGDVITKKEIFRKLKKLSWPTETVYENRGWTDWEKTHI